jgi:3'-phosphoadenosine 5'-phosphosulfate sulfotransferase (PAPS reductase)/FAD synthetase
MMIDYFLFTSCGNDSVALMQWAYDRYLPNVLVVYNDTGWHHPDWEQRIEEVDQLAGDMGFMFVRTKGIGMQELCEKKQITPAFRRQFCTQELKIKPSLELMDEHDPNKESTVLIGVRREESVRRSTFPEHTEESVGHGGRSLWAPLVRYTEEQRDSLLKATGMDILPHRSRECFPCIYQRKEGIAEMSEEDIIKVEEIEKITGSAWFNPNSKQGNDNIRDVVKWARTNNYKKSNPNQIELLDVGCDSGYCGD